MEEKLWYGKADLTTSLLINYKFQSQNDFLRAWLPDCQVYLKELLEMEHLPAEACNCGITEDLIQYTNCFSTKILCRTCCLEAHKFLPFHRINRWDGNFFTWSSLHAQGYIMHLGHSGDPCPEFNNVAQEVRMDNFVEEMGISSEDAEEEKNTDFEDGWLNLEDIPMEQVVVIVHTTGVFQHHVRWCTCPGHAKEDIQLLRSCLFPASNHRPRTAMECKTSGDSFFQKLRHLTNNAFPHVVPVMLLLYLKLLWH